MATRREEMAMAEVDIQTALDWRGRTVVDRDGERIGTLKEIYLDDSERPGWGSVHTALFGLRQTLIPLGEVVTDDDQLRLPYDGQHVKDAPNLDPDVQLTPDEEDALFRHYGMGGEDAAPRADDAMTRSEEGGEDAAPGADDAITRSEEGGEDAAPGADDAITRSEEGGKDAAPGADDAMTRSEEEVRIGTRTRVRGKARLKKYVVTDYVEKKVPVKREEVRVEYEPADEGDQ
jgi:hypothetical protein